jgi:serine/threonine protein phosphatase PrpC
MSGDAQHDSDEQPKAGELGETLAPEPGAESWSRSKPAGGVVQPTPAGIVLRVYGQSDVGLIREHNEDDFMIADLSDDSGPLPGEEEVSRSVSDRGIALAVCDGMGGAAAGEVASQMAVNTLFEKLRGETPPAGRDDFARRLVLAIEEAGARIFSEAKKDRTRRGMGTTATVAGLVDKVLFIGQVGDSRCYILRTGRLNLVTKDQSLVNQLIEAGQLTESEAEAFEHSNIILQALGTTEQVVVDLTFVELRRGDRLLLCSDGLSGLVHDGVVREEMACIGPLPQLAERLIDLANAAGGHDNITCIVADFDGEALEPPEEGALPFYQQYPLPGGGDGRASSAPALPHLVRSVVPRPGSSRREQPEARTSDIPEPPSRSWSTAASVLALLGLAAVITIVSAGRRATPTSFPPPPAYADAQVPVEVEVQAAFDNAELFVNGQTYGPLRSDEPVRLRLLPGAYHIEAREADGTQLAQDVMVRPGVSAKVVLVPSTD